ncbi:MAG: hypothetical protein HN553_00960 [Opitutae bacterium]|jgi:hypothetical protein|nr:hypothetical protein [Opitutae bacterium]
MIDEPFESNETNNSPESSASSASEPSPDQKREISSWVADGMGLSDIQKKINTDFGIVMTYIDVRFLVDDLNLTLVDEEEEAKPEDSEAGNDVKEELSPDSPLDGDKGGVSVELDTVNPPGAMASGSVVFSDGQSKKWTLDQFGRLGLSGGDEGYKPSDEDVMEFQKQLDTSLRGRGI